MAAPMAVPIVLDEVDRRGLQRLAGSQTAPVRAARRARIVLAAADGAGNEQVAAELRCSPNTVRT
jgi:DNA-binding CsgD family transcriptional regulator